jgi:hypothetical protein
MLKFSDCAVVSLPARLLPGRHLSNMLFGMKVKHTQILIQDKYANKTGEHHLCQLDRIAEDIDILARDSLKNGVLCGILCGHENEIRQDAILMVLDWLMRGDRDGTDSQVAGKKIANIPWNLSRLVAKALRLCKLRAIRHLTTEGTRNESLNEVNGGYCLHPTDLSSWELSNAIRRQMALTALQVAVQSGRLSASNACIARQLLSGRMSVEDVAKHLKVSSNAIYQRLNRIRRILPDIVAEIEVPFF